MSEETAHLTRIEGELQSNPLPSSADTAILHGLLHHRRMGRLDSDNLGVALPFPSSSLTYVNGMALVIDL